MFHSMPKTIPKSNPHLLVRKIFVQSKWAFIDCNPLPNQIKLVDDVIHCRTSAMGSYLKQCPNGQQPQVVYYRCKNRLCPCHYIDNKKWLPSTMGRLMLPCSHSLVTVTPPQGLCEIINWNRYENDYKKQYAIEKFLYDLLLTTPASVIKEYANDPYYLGGLVGIISILQTWRYDLQLFPHAHIVVPNIGFYDGQLIEPETFDWIDVDRVSDRMTELALQHVIINQHLLKPETYRHFVKCLQEGQWEVHCEPTGNEVKKVKDEYGNIRYEADHTKNYMKVLKYSKHSPLTGKRVVIEGNDVTLHYKTYSGQRMKETMTCLDFTLRYTQHALPPNYRQVRYSGLFHSSKSYQLQTVKKLLLEKMYLESCSEIDTGLMFLLNVLGSGDSIREY